ncbi:MAG: ferritin family protein [Negativicutes bacterium]|nr:ferritin family protein [Negativicutes bacterium]
MDIFDFALKMELDGEKFYRDLAGKTSFAELKPVLEGLAEDEKRHYQIIQSVQQQTLHFIEADPALANLDNVFSKSKGVVPGDKEFVSRLKGEQTDAYRAALEKEKESVELYGKLGANAKGAEERTICNRLRQEEEKHVELLEDIIDMLNHVHDWVDTAEFNNPDAY